MSEVRKVLVVGSINVDLYRRLSSDGGVNVDGQSLQITPIKGMTLPAPSFVRMLNLPCEQGQEEALVVSDRPTNTNLPIREAHPLATPSLVTCSAEGRWAV
jgi:hypothetical protein